MELHSGAHVSLDHECVQAVCIESAQHVIGSVGGVQIMLPILQSMLGKKSIGIMKEKKDSDEDEVVIYSLVPDLLNLLSCFVRGNNQNARELLRCGGIDIVEQLLFENKAKTVMGAPYKKYSKVRALFVFPSLSKLLVQTLLELQSSCSHYLALETKVFSRLLFNIPLWFEGRAQDAGVPLYRYLLPVLSSIVQKDPVKVRDCVGATDMIWLMRDIVEMKVSLFLDYILSIWQISCNISSLIYSTLVIILEQREGTEGYEYFPTRPQRSG